MRLFIAIGFSNSVKDALMRAVEELRRQGSGNFTRRENLHLTLAFLGELPDEKEAAAVLSRVKGKAFDISLGEMGNFRDLIWAGTVPEPELTALQNVIITQLRNAGLPFDNKPFRPHLTLCRRFTPFGIYYREAVERALGKPSCRVDRVSLMLSSRVNGRLTYTELAHKTLLTT